MGRMVLLNPKIHKDLRVNQDKVEGHGANIRLIPVVLSEFLRLAIQYPIVITKNNETGQFVCVSVFGFDNGENLFWKQGTWDAIYTPLNVMRQPFFVGNDKPNENSDGEDKFVICVDEDSESVQDGTGEPVFDGEGKGTPYLEKIKSMLAELLDGETHTDQFVKKILALDLLTPMSLDITFVNDESQRVDGTYTIDEDKLNKLSTEALVELRDLGYLGAIYTMIVSLGHFYSLINRKNAMLNKGADWFRKVEA